MPENDRLLDEWAVQQVINSYAQSTGRGDWNPVVALFVPEASWEIPHLDLKFEGYDNQLEALRQSLSRPAPRRRRPDRFEYRLRSGGREVVLAEQDLPPVLRPLLSRLEGPV